MLLRIPGRFLCHIISIFSVNETGRSLMVNEPPRFTIYSYLYFLQPQSLHAPQRHLPFLQQSPLHVHFPFTQQVLPLAHTHVPLQQPCSAAWAHTLPRSKNNTTIVMIIFFMIVLLLIYLVYYETCFKLDVSADEKYRR